MSIEQDLSGPSPGTFGKWYSLARDTEDRWSWHYALGSLTRQNQRYAGVFDCSDDESIDYADLVSRLELSKDIEIACTVLGGAMYKDLQWDMIMKMYFCFVFSRLTWMLQKGDDDLEKRLLVIASGIEGGVLGSVGVARLYTQSLLYSRDNTVMQDFELLGLVPRGRAVKIDRGNGGPDPLDLKIALLETLLSEVPSIECIQSVDTTGPTFNEHLLEQRMVWMDGKDVPGMSAIESPHPSKVVYTGNAYPEEGELGEWRTMNDVICEISRQFADRSVKLVVNGGTGAAYELSKVVKNRGRIIVLKGSQRFADAVASWVEGTTDRLSDKQRQDLNLFLSSIEGIEEETRLRIEVYDMFAEETIMSSASELAKLVVRGRNR